MNGNNLKWLYFSASTMDPWVDFIGVPKEATDEHGNKYLDLVRPKAFQNDEVEAIFFDELNRAPAKVRNAVMELIQFKSINGKRFNNLKIIWAAINPESKDDDLSSLSNKYDVETLDPAQKDRFQIIVNVDNKPDKQFFYKKYGENGKAAVAWWQSLPNDAKSLISPRRLDYIIDVYDKGGDIKDVIPTNISCQQLLSQLKNGVHTEVLKKLLAANDLDGLTKRLTDNNFYQGVKKELLDKKLFPTISTCFSNEELSNLISTNNNIRAMLTTDKELMAKHTELVLDIIKTKGTSKKIINELRAALPEDEKNEFDKGDINSIEEKIIDLYGNYINRLDSTYQRRKAIDDCRDIFKILVKVKYLNSGRLYDMLKIYTIALCRTYGGASRYDNWIGKLHTKYEEYKGDQENLISSVILEIIKKDFPVYVKSSSSCEFAANMTKHNII